MTDLSGNNANSGNNGNGANGGNNNGAVPVFPNGPTMGNPTDPAEIADILINYNEKFQNGAEAMFREEIIKQCFSTLIRKNKPNAILMGPAGTGKTRIVEDIAYRLASNNPTVPDSLKDYTIYELPLNSLNANTELRGALEAKLQAVIAFAEEPKNKAIIFIDEIHQLTNSHHSSFKEIAQALKPALARGNMRVIGATTTQEEKSMMSDPAFNRRFSKIIVDELTKAQTVEILKSLKASFIQHHKNRVLLDDTTFETVVNLADEFRKAGSHRPDNAITLLDSSISDSVIRRVYDEYNLRNNPQMLQALKAIPQIPVTEAQIRQTAIRLATGNSKPDKLDVQKLTDALSAIKGQDQILETLIKEVRKNEANLIPSPKPLTMLFVGPSGVGKTEVTKIVAKELTGCAPITLNMTEYHSPASINRIIGAPAGYIGSDSDSELPFDALESNPYQVILLDEFEKCDQSVQKLFMSVFDEGTLKTNRGDTIDFSRAIIIATTNAGYEVMRNQIGFAEKKPNAKASTPVKTLAKWFDPALLNRFDERIVTFNAIDEDVYRNILASKYASILAQIRDTHPNIKQLPDAIPDDELDKIVKTTYVPEFGARPAAKAVEDYVYDKVL